MRTYHATLDHYDFTLGRVLDSGHRAACYKTRIKIPLTYADGLWRISIYAWLDKDGQHDGRGWFAMINSHRIGKGYKTPQSAALAVRRAIGTVCRSIPKTIPVKRLVRSI